MERAITVPRWLGFSWWWLFAMAIVSVACFWIPGIGSRLNTCVDVVLLLWLVVQAAWLRSVERESTAVFWLVATVVLEAPSYLYSDMSASHSGWWAVLTLLNCICSIVGFCYFIRDLQWLVQRTGKTNLHVSYLMTIFFNVFYFQYKLREVSRMGPLLEPAPDLE